MNQQISDRDRMTKWIVVFIDLVFMNLLYYAASYFQILPETHYSQYFWNVAYVLSILVFVPVAQNRLVNSELVVSKALVTGVSAVILYTFECHLGNAESFHYKKFFAMLIAASAVLIIVRLLTRSIIKGLRRRGQDNRVVVFAGAGVNIRALYDRMKSNISTGYRVEGYFEDQKSRNLGDLLPRLGKVSEIISYLESHNVDLLFCNLPSSRAEEIVEIMNYCDNHLIRFYSVPNVRNYVHRAMEVEFVDDIPVLSVRKEPLRNPLNKLFKRVFDIIFSGLFLILVFWWVFIIVAIITEITMPGPVFFRQKRNGLYGKEFTCLKFRSMKVNDDADKVQATKNDPRKTKWGNIMRKTNIDELPQFINVFFGDMSVVGPRPHMVKHTEEYGALINKYMVRHFAKPGITGWAQVTGSRGETSELWMMEERIQKDIWYVENWTPMLDIKIIYKTITNILGGEKGNAY